MNSNLPTLTPRTLDWFLHGAGLVGLAVIGLAACLLAGRLAPPPAPRHAPGASAAARLEATRAELLDIEPRWRATRAEAQRLCARVPQQPHDAAFLKEVTELAESAGMQVRECRPSSLGSEGDFARQSFELVCWGSYPSLCRFLDGLPRLPRLSVVERLDIQVDGESENYPCALTVAVFHGRPPTAPAAGGNEHG